jgi:creatinine amidohydrolase
MHLSDATWTEVRDADADLALLPVGSTEQHGPHAPLGTDAYHAETVAAAGADRYDGEVLVAPTIPVGVAEEHRRFPGTLWVSADAFRRYVRDVIGSLARHGQDRIVVVNGHGGNVHALAEVTATVTRHDDAYAVPFTWFEAVGDLGSEMGHAGLLETALLRATRPELVREGQIEAAREAASETWGDWVSGTGTNLAFDSDEFTENGVVGDPSAGDAELGAELLDRAAASLVRVLAAVADR